MRGALIAFDLDGTLVDTAPDLLRALNATLTESGRAEVPPERVRGYVGHGARAMLERAGEALGAPIGADAAPTLVERFIEIYRADIAAHSRPYPGVEAALIACGARGATLAVCTNKRTDLAEALLAALSLRRHFAAVIGADAAPARKPDARHLYETRARAGLPDTAPIVMIGDSETDVAAARAAGAPVAIVRFGYAGAPVETLGADAIIERFSQTPEIVRQLLAGRTA